jgi:hypothetical protein
VSLIPLVRGSSKGERNGRRKQSLAWEGRRTEDARSEEFFDWENEFVITSMSCPSLGLSLK